MKRELRRAGGVFLGVLIAIGAVPSSAQEKHPAPDPNLRIEVEKMMQDGVRPPEGDFIFFASEMGFNERLVKGAPYSAEAITESTQTLSDGNRIVNKSTAFIYRDSEGRTRREQALKAIGPFANGGEPPQTIYISDPVADVSYVLDPRTRVARKMPPMRFKFEYKLPPPAEGKLVGQPDSLFHAEVQADLLRKATDEDLALKKAPAVSFVAGWGNHVGRNESLGRQNIGGVDADGTRSTVTIPAGEIGNERPIEIIHERWYSPELKTVVMNRHSDPRFGETTYRLTNIDRSEPARSLFEVPVDYKIYSRTNEVQKMRVKKPGAEQ